MKKNEIYEITIEDIGNDGEGIGHIEDAASGKRLAVFVKDTVPGDLARVKIIKDKKNYAYGRLEEIISPSKDRVEPRCKLARACGGCSMQQYSYEAQLLYKQQKVANCLERIGDIKNALSYMEPITGMFTGEEAQALEERPELSGRIRANVCEKGHWNYRNKAQFPVGYDREGKLVAGFYAGRTHSIIPGISCDIQAEVCEPILEAVLAYMEKNGITAYDEEKHIGLVRHILIRVGFTTGQIMVCLIINGDKLPDVDKLLEALVGIEGMTSICININKEKTNRILGDACRTLWGRDYIEDYIGNIRYQISPMSFYQVNPVQTTKLYEKALEYAGLSGGETVWDLYCGIGTISLFLAQKAGQVYGVEIVPQAIEDAKKNASINGIDNAAFFVGKAEEVLPREYRENGIHADVIVVDPPRKGCDETLLDTIVAMSPASFVYVSCDPATLARDLKIMLAKGYKLEKVACYDQFCHGGHVETVCLLSRKVTF